MSKFFVPYVGEQPAAISIKGHRLLILANSHQDLLASLDTIGGDKVREILLWEDDTTELAKLASEINGGVVVAPPGITIENMIHELERELPWVH